MLSWLNLGRLGVDLGASAQIFGTFLEHFGGWVGYRKTYKNLRCFDVF